jgi:hypothetical protein
MRGQVVRHADYQSGPFCDLVVAETDGEHVTVHALGSPQRAGYDGRSVYHRGELVTRTAA